MRKGSSLVMAIAAMTASTAALANSYPPPPVAPPPAYYAQQAAQPQDDVQQSTPAPQTYDERSNEQYGDDNYAEVLSTQPVYHLVRVAQPQQQCYQQQVVYRDNRNGDAGTLIGALIGGVVGNQFGHGSARFLTTVGGAAVGASLGNDVARRGEGPPQVGYQERCDTINAVHDEQQLDGYDVTYRYAGRVYNTRLPYDPGARLAVNVAVAPASY